MVTGQAFVLFGQYGAAILQWEFQLCFHTYLQWTKATNRWKWPTSQWRLIQRC